MWDDRGSVFDFLSRGNLGFPFFSLALLFSDIIRGLEVSYGHFTKNFTSIDGSFGI